jgi:hypothetical protein
MVGDSEQASEAKPVEWIDRILNKLQGVHKESNHTREWLNVTLAEFSTATGCQSTFKHVLSAPLSQASSWVNLEDKR